MAPNIAESLGSGISFLIGCYEMDVYGEARWGPEGFITVDPERKDRGRNAFGVACQRDCTL
jgi:hypothetical protein